MVGTLQKQNVKLHINLGVIILVRIWIDEMLNIVKTFTQERKFGLIQLKLL